MVPWIYRKFSRKLALAFCLLTFFGIVLTSFLMEHAFQKNLLEELTHGLGRQASFVAAQIDSSLFVRKDKPKAQALAHQLGDIGQCRVTLVAADGEVIGDSDVSTERLARLENHKDRPEIKEAFLSGQGHSMRFSDTLKIHLLYVAVGLKNQGRTVGVVRVALPLTNVNSQLGLLQRRLIFLMIVGIVIATFFAFWLSNSISRPITAMTEAANKLTQGLYDTRIESLTNDEHGRLGETLNLLAEQVRSKIQELSHDKAHLATILSNMTEGVVAVDSAGRIIEVNPALCTVFSVDANEAKGKLFLEVLRHSQLDQLIQGVLQQRTGQTDEVRLFTPEEHVFEAHAVPLIESDRATGVLLVLHDITRIRRLEQVRRDFVANVSHELRTPLASIKGFAETLRSGGLEDAKHRLEFVEAIEKHADRMTALVEDLLDLAAIESGQRTPIRESVDVAELGREIVAGILPLAKRGRITVENDLPGDLPRLEVDRGQLRQVLTNLLDNALKFNRENGTIKVAARAANKFLLIIVEDTGSGIPSQDLPRIFERFYRVDKARSRERGGTGLGLSIVKHIVEAHGGTILVESVIGKGSTFTVSFPL